METSNLRQPLAVVFCDIAGTSHLMAREGDLVTSMVLHDFFEHSGRLSKEHDCTLIKFIGDGFLAAFANAADGLRFARSIQSLLRTLPALSGRGLGFRLSLHFGDCLSVHRNLLRERCFRRRYQPCRASERPGAARPDRDLASRL